MPAGLLPVRQKLASCHLYPEDVARTLAAIEVAVGVLPIHVCAANAPGIVCPRLG